MRACCTAAWRPARASGATRCKGGEGRATRWGRDAEDAAELVGPLHLVGLEIPRPRAEVREALGLGQLALALLEPGFGVLALGDVVVDPQDQGAATEGDERGGIGDVQQAAIFAAGGGVRPGPPPPPGPRRGVPPPGG